jgi:hypothetical protein
MPAASTITSIGVFAVGNWRIVTRYCCMRADSLAQAAATRRVLRFTRPTREKWMLPSST